MTTGKQRWKAPGPKSNVGGDPLHDVSFSPDGNTVALSSPSEPVHLYDAKTGQKRGTIGTAATCLAYSPDGSLVALGFHPNRSIALWSLSTGKEVRRFEGHGSTVSSLSLSRDGKTLASGSYDGSVRLWDVAAAKELHSWPGHQYRLFSLAYLPGDRSLVSYGSDYTVRLWDAERGKELRRLTLVALSQLGPEHDFRYHDPNRHLHALAVSPDGKTVAVCNPGRSLHLWDTVTGNNKCLLKGQPVYWLAFSPDGKALASGDRPLDRVGKALIRLWDPATGQLKQSFRAPGLRGLLFAPDGKTLMTGNLVLGEQPGLFFCGWDLKSGKEVSKWRCSSAVPPVIALAIASDGGTLAVGGLVREPAVHHVLLADTRVRTLRRPLNRGTETKGHTEQTNGIAFSPDGKLLASAGEFDRSVRAWEVSTGQELLRFEGHAAAVSSVALTPDGTKLASGSDDTTILVWDLLESGRQRLKSLGKDLTPLWADLGSKDEKVAYRALCALVLARDRGVDLLGQHLQPVPEDKTRKPAQQLIDDLNHEKFEVREAATRELRARGWAVASALRQAQADPPTEEVRRRLKDLLTELEKKPASEWLRPQRAIGVLERVNTGKAKQLLEKLARGAPAAEQTQDARAALTRFRRR